MDPDVSQCELGGFGAVEMTLAADPKLEGRAQKGRP